MSLWLLIVIVVGGIAAVAIALHALGLSQTAKLEAGNIRAHWQRHFPDDSFNRHGTVEFLLNEHFDRAIVRSDQGYGLIWVMGADTAARQLPAGAITENAGGVTFSFPDPSAPKIHVALGEADRQVWLPYLRKFHGLS